jgi:O-Antigen ligase
MPIRTAQVSVVRTYGAFLLVLYLLATSRWGSYLLPGPPYVTDLVIVLLIIDRIVALPLPGHILSRTDPTLCIGVAALIVIAVIEFAAGSHSADAVRDAAPFFYAVVVFLTAPLTGRNAEVAGRLLTVCLIAHMAWSSVSLAIPAIGHQYATPGNPSVDFLSLRSDFDGLVNGFAAAIGLYRVLTTGRGAALFVWGSLLVVVAHSRISLLVTVLLLICVVGYARAQEQRGFALLSLPSVMNRLGQLQVRGRNRALAKVALALVVIIVGVLVFSPTALDRLGGTFGADQSTALGRQAAGTTHAREAAWSRLEKWITSSESRTFLGAGFGPNIMIASGASISLVNRDDPTLRAPHNFLLSVWAHLGLVGLIAFLVVAAVGVRLAIAVRGIQMSDVDVLACLIVVGVPLAALVGVVMESPFGAVPYFWALGQLGSHLELRSRVTPSRVRASYLRLAGEHSAT